MLRKLYDDVHAMIDLGMVMGIAIAFIGMAIIGFVLWIVRNELVNNLPTGNASGDATGTNWSVFASNGTIRNITMGFDSAVNLLIVAITIFVLAIAISALLILRRR